MICMHINTIYKHFINVQNRPLAFFMPKQQPRQNKAARESFWNLIKQKTFWQRGNVYIIRNTCEQGKKTANRNNIKHGRQ